MARFGFKRSKGEKAPGQDEEIHFDLSGTRVPDAKDLADKFQFSDMPSVPGGGAAPQGSGEAPVGRTRAPCTATIGTVSGSATR